MIKLYKIMMCSTSSLLTNQNYIQEEIKCRLSLNAYKNIGLAVNIGKTKYMEIGRHRSMIANAHIKERSNSYEKVKTFKYLGSLLKNQNYIQEEI